MKNFFGFGGSKKAVYSAPQIAQVPEGQSTEENGSYINEARRQIVVKIFDAGKPEDLALALGTLEVAKDVVKATLSSWHLKDAQTKRILIPVKNGHP